MKEECNKLNLSQKLVEIRRGIGYLQKTEKGNQGASYVDPAVLLQKIRSGMDKHNVLLIPSVTSSINKQVPAPTSKNKDNIDFISENILVYKFIDADTGETISVPWIAVASHMTDPAMAFGSALTYSERYFLLKFNQIPTSKDDPEYFKHKTGTTEPVNENQLANILAKMDEKGTDLKTVLVFGGVSRLEDFPESKYEAVMNAFEVS